MEIDPKAPEEAESSMQMDSDQSVTTFNNITCPFYFVIFVKP